MLPGHFSYIGAPAPGFPEHHLPMPPGPPTPPYPLQYGDVLPPVGQTRALTRPTPLRYTLPARGGSSGVYEAVASVSGLGLSLSTPHLAAHSPNGAPYGAYGELQLPDIYAEHAASTEAPVVAVSAAVAAAGAPVAMCVRPAGGAESLRRKRRTRSHTIDALDLRHCPDYAVPPPACLTELRSAHSSSSGAAIYGRSSVYSLEAGGGGGGGAGGCNSCAARLYGETGGGGMALVAPGPRQDAPLLSKRKAHRRPSFLRATWGPERVRPPPLASRRGDLLLPDLFPCGGGAEVYGGTTLCYPAALDPLRLATGRGGPHQSRSHKGHKLRHSQSTRLPSYHEALLTHPAAIGAPSHSHAHAHSHSHSAHAHARSASLLQRAPVRVTSDPSLPVSSVCQRPLPYGPVELCHIFPCMPPPQQQHGGDGGGDAGVYAAYRATPHHAHHHHSFAAHTLPHALGGHGEDVGGRGGGVGGEGEPPMVWGRISSLESEV